MTDIWSSILVFILAAFLGLEVIKRVSPLLHTPLMSLTNAISAIAVIGAIEIAGEQIALGLDCALRLVPLLPDHLHGSALGRGEQWAVCDGVLRGTRLVGIHSGPSLPR